MPHFDQLLRASEAHRPYSICSGWWRHWLRLGASMAPMSNAPGMNRWRSKNKPCNRFDVEKISPLDREAACAWLLHSAYFCSASSSSLLHRGAPDYSLDTVSGLTTNNEWRTCPRFLRGGCSGIRTWDLSDARHRTYYWVTCTPHTCHGEVVWKRWA